MHFNHDVCYDSLYFVKLAILFRTASQALLERSIRVVRVTVRQRFRPCAGSLSNPLEALLREVVVPFSQ